MLGDRYYELVKEFDKDTLLKFLQLLQSLKKVPTSMKNDTNIYIGFKVFFFWSDHVMYTTTKKH